jgi:hypothetical protein
MSTSSPWLIRSDRKKPSAVGIPSPTSSPTQQQQENQQLATQTPQQRNQQQQQQGHQTAIDLPGPFKTPKRTKPKKSPFAWGLAPLPTTTKSTEKKAGENINLVGAGTVNGVGKQAGPSRPIVTVPSGGFTGIEVEVKAGVAASFGSVMSVSHSESPEELSEKKPQNHKGNTQTTSSTHPVSNHSTKSVLPVSVPTETIANRYTTTRTVGVGSFGKVKHATDLKTGKAVALKMVSKKLLEGNDRARKGLEGEVEIMRVSGPLAPS